MNKGSCDITDVINVGPQEPIPEKNPNEMTFLNVDPEKVEAMKAYALQLRKKFPHMKQQRLGRKVAEYFKVKLV
jgi:hypothetical protein